MELVEHLEHLECHGSRGFGGCLGQLLFDMIAVKVINPYVALNITIERKN